MGAESHSAQSHGYTHPHRVSAKLFVIYERPEEGLGCSATWLQAFLFAAAKARVTSLFPLLKNVFLSGGGNPFVLHNT